MKAGQGQQIGAAYVLMAPALILVAGVLAYPLAWEIWVSFTAFSTHAAATEFVGLANYRRMAGDPFFWRALLTTGAYLAITTIAKLALGLAMALLLAPPSRRPALGFLAVFLPWSSSGAVTVIALYWMLSPPLITSSILVLRLW